MVTGTKQVLYLFFLNVAFIIGHVDDLKANNLEYKGCLFERERIMQIIMHMSNLMYCSNI
jgi:hypothetical protein